MTYKARRNQPQNTATAKSVAWLRAVVLHGIPMSA